MTDADDASARIERFAADVDAKLRQLRDELAAEREAADAERLRPPTPSAPPPDAPATRLPPDTPAPPPPPPPPRPTPPREPLLITLPPEHEPEPPPPPRPARRWPRRVGRMVVLVLVVVLVLLVLAVAVGPAFLSYDTFVMRSGSMAPAIPRGSFLLVSETDSNDIGPGDVITFEAPDDHTRVTHRVVTLETTSGEPTFVTKGDSNPAPDPWRVRATGTQLRYRFHVALVGYVFAVLAAPVARIGLLAASLMVVALEVRRRRSA